MSTTPQRQTALAVVDAFNRMDIDEIISHRSSDCMRYILPSTLGHSPTNNEQYAAHLRKLKPVFQNFNLTVNDVLEERESHRICMYLRARADTLAGEYINEYMWTLDFDETGTKITKVNEFVDTGVNVNFWPKLARAMRDTQSAQQKDS